MISVQLDENQAFKRAIYVSQVSEQTDYKFELSSVCTEYVTCVRYNRFDGKISQCQLQTNLGRRSPWFGNPRIRFPPFEEIFADPGKAIIECKVEGQNIRLKNHAPPREKRKKLALIQLLLKNRAAIFEDNPNSASIYSKFKSGPLRKKVPISPFVLFFSRSPTLARLILEDNEPASIFQLLTQRGNSFDLSILDLFLLNEPNNSIASLAFQYSSYLKTSIGMACLKSHPGMPSLARLFLTPNKEKGFRSIQQLILDDEIYDDVERPSILRMLLFGEDKKDCTLRLLFTKNPNYRNTSVTDLLLAHDSRRRPSLLRLALSKDSNAIIARLLTDSPYGKVAIGKYIFAGGRYSIIRKTLISETRGMPSILRLLITKKSGVSCSLIELLLKTQVDGSTIFDQMTAETHDDKSLARIVFSTTYRIYGGLIESISNEDIPPALIRSGSILSETGTTLAHFFLSGELENNFSPLRALMIGEDENATEAATTHAKSSTGVESELPIKSILRLLCEPARDGKPNLISLLLQEAKRLILEKKSFQLQALLPVFSKLRNRIKELGPDFLRSWRESWTFVATDMFKYQDENSSHLWKLLLPRWSKLCILVGKRKWTQAFMKFTGIATILDREYGNRFMLSQYVASKVAKAGVATGFGISKGILRAVSNNLPLPIASNVLDGVHDILHVAENLTHTGIDVATNAGVAITGAAMKMKRKSQEDAAVVEINLSDDDEVGNNTDEDEDDWS